VVLILTRSEIMTLIDMMEAIEVTEKAFREYATGNAQLPQRITITIPEKNGWIGTMSAYLKGMEAAASKVVTSYPKNKLRGQPTISGIVLYLNHETGEPMAIMEAAYLTALRTGAASGVATKYLARKESKRAGVIGTGMQAKFQLEALATVRELNSASVYSPNPEHRTRFAEEAGRKLGIEITPTNSATQVVETADILVTATSAREPVVEGARLREGVHINGVGSHNPQARELDSMVVKRAKVVVDSREAALSEAGDLLIPIAEGGFFPRDIYAELGEIVTGAKPGRERPDEITLFKSVGLAIQDVAVAKAAYDKARIRGVGLQFEL